MLSAFRRLALTISVVAVLVLLRPAPRAALVDCPTVISTINRQVRAGGGKGPDIKNIAKKLGTSRVWVEQCMRAYGRRLPRLADQSSEIEEGRLEELEEAEPEDELPEDVAAPEYDRQAKPGPKERVPKIQQKPTPNGLE